MSDKIENYEFDKSGYIIVTMPTLGSLQAENDKLKQEVQRQTILRNMAEKAEKKAIVQIGENLKHHLDFIKKYELKEQEIQRLREALDGVIKDYADLIDIERQKGREHLAEYLEGKRKALQDLTTTKD